MTSPRPGRARRRRRLRQISLVLLEPVAMFETGVVVEVFGLDRTDEGVPAFDFRVCAVEPGRPLATRSTAPLTIAASHGLDAVAGSDLVVVVANLVERNEDYPVEVLQVIREAYDDGATLLSLCSGSFVLGAAGLLDGRRSTTHWRYAEQMQERFPETALDPRALFVEDGTIITSAGTAAGIDACLHLVRRELGTAVATKIARRMVVAPQRDGGQQQFVELPIPRVSEDSLGPVLAWVLAHLDQPHTAATLAKRAMLSERTFARRFTAETGTTPHKWLTQQRMLAARSLLEESDLSVEQIAARVGFNSAVVLREHFRRETGLSPQSYRQRFGPMPAVVPA